MSTPEKYPERLRALLGGTWYVHNAGVGGANIASTDHEAIDRDTDGRRTKDVLVVLLGTNDVLLNLGNGTVCYNRYRAWCLARRTPGKKLVVCTLPAWHDDPWGKEAERLIFNDLVRTNYIDFADRLADAGDDPILGTFSAAPVWLDNIHLDSAGCEALANLVHAEVLTL